MHILSIFSTDVFYGIASHVIGLAKRLHERGYKITLMTRGHSHGLVELNVEGFRLIRVPFYPFYPLHVHFHGYFVRRVIEFLSPKPDLIHLHSPLVPPVSKKWPIVTTFHTPMLADSSYIERLGIKTSLMKLMGRTTSYHIEKRLLKISDAIITVSEMVADELRRYYRYPSDNLYPILNVVDIEFYSPSHLSPTKKNLLYIGRLGYRKGLFELIRSAKKVCEKHPDVKYILVGSGPLETTLRNEIQRLDLSANFKFCGVTRNSGEILDYYRQAYAVMLPSYYEGFPMVLAESMACGKPVVTTTAGFGKGILKNGLNALLVTPKSSEELAKATLKLLSSQELCRKLGEEARKTAVRKLNPKTNTDKVERVYEIAINNWGRR